MKVYHERNVIPVDHSRPPPILSSGEGARPIDDLAMSRATLCSSAYAPLPDSRRATFDALSVVFSKSSSDLFNLRSRGLIEASSSGSTFS